MVIGPLTDANHTRLFDAAAHSLTARTVFVSDLQDGQAVDEVFVVRDRTLRKKRNGEDFLKLSLADCSGSVPAVAWEHALELHGLAEPGTALRVRGRHDISERYGRQLTVETLLPAEEHEYRLVDLMEGPAVSPEQMEADLRRLIATVHNPHLARLLDSLYGPESPVWQRFRRAPAAKFYHQAYAHGLLEHTLSVGQAVSAISTSFPGIDRDVAVTGALIHDVGKIEAYSLDPGVIDLSDEGRLLGEIPLGYYLVRRQIEQLDGFPPELARAVLHIVLSHHGALENGSPVIPATREATIVHAIDNLGGKLGSFDRLEKGLQQGESWSQWDRALSGAAYFAGAAREQAPAPGQALPAASGE